MFIESELTNLYFSIINKYKNTVVEGYTETHHIIPKSCGGSDDKDNLVRVPANIHYQLHSILPKILKNGNHKDSMLYAWWRMNNIVNKNNEQNLLTPEKYAELRENHSKAVSRKQKNKIVEKSTRKMISDAAIKQKRWMGENNPMYNSQRFSEKNPFYGKTHNAVSKQKMSNSSKGKGGLKGDKNPAKRKNVRQKMSKSWENRKIIVCPHCELESKSMSMMTRWHFKNCKLNDSFWEDWENGII